MLTYAQAIEEFGISLANIMLEEEYNQFIRGVSKEIYNPEEYIDFDVDIKDTEYKYEKLY